MKYWLSRKLIYVCPNFIGGPTAIRSIETVHKNLQANEEMDPTSVIVDGKESFYFTPWDKVPCGAAMKNIGDAFNIFAQTVTANASHLLDQDINNLDTGNNKVSKIFWNNLLSVVKDKKLHEHLLYVKNKKGKPTPKVFN